MLIKKSIIFSKRYIFFTSSVTVTVGAAAALVSLSPFFDMQIPHCNP